MLRFQRQIQTTAFRHSQVHALQKLPTRKPSMNSEIQDRKNLDLPVFDQDVIDLYSVLKQNPSQPAIGPDAKYSLKLDENYLNSLKLRFVDSTNEFESNLLERNSNLNQKLSSNNTPSLETLSELIHINAITNRPVQAQEAFDAIEKFSLKPDLVAFNHLLNAYASVKDMDKCIEIFKLIKERDGPDLVSYSTLIKVCIENNDLDSAFKLYEDMKIQKMSPNQIILSMLIKGCLQKNDLDRAWKTFNYLRTHIERPDSITYTLMIYACSKSQDTERALDLFQEMIGQNLPISSVTFNSLIAACAVRKDYYREAMSLLEQMVANGFQPDVNTFNSILRATSTNNDILLTRTIWNDLISRISTNRLPLQYHAEDFMANSVENINQKLTANESSVVLEESKLNNPIEGEQVPEQKIDANLTEEKTLVDYNIKKNYLNQIHNTSPLPFIPNNSTYETILEAFTNAMKVVPPKSKEKEQEIINTAASGPKFVQVSILPKEESVNPELQELQILYPKLTSSKLSRSSFIEEANIIWKHIDELIVMGRLKMTSNLWNKRLAMLCEDRRGIQKAYDFFESFEKYGIERNARSFKLILKSTIEQKQHFELGLKIWKEFLDWDAQLEKQMIESSEIPLSLQEKEDYRKLSGRTPKAIQGLFLTMVRRYAHRGELAESLKVLGQIREFRFPYYLPPVVLGDIWVLLEKSQDEASKGNLDYLKELKVLVPHIQKDDPQLKVQGMLKQKTISKHWWGYKLMGMDPLEKEKSLRKQHMKNRKIMQQEMTIRRKGEQHQLNRQMKLKGDSVSGKQ
ncbi:hypothetical protein BC833DRAFT_658972 [Globomyces pollinis-pini]|nr:hypothetical protein BC833DRAFT_658972 [Globomyces pollinis-pini]